MVDIGMETGEKMVLKLKNRTERRKHGEVFGSEREIRKLLDEGEEAVVIVRATGLQLYGEPSREKEDIEKLKTGATIYYGKRNFSGKIRIIKK